MEQIISFCFIHMLDINQGEIEIDELKLHQINSNFKLKQIEFSEMAQFRKAIRFFLFVPASGGNLRISIGEQEIAGFPVKPLSQKQFGAWFRTVQTKKSNGNLSNECDVLWLRRLGELECDVRLTRIDWANARTWILAFVIYAGFRLITFGILYTFWSASSVWISVVFRYASARTNAILFLADGISSAGWRFARTRWW